MGLFFNRQGKIVRAWTFDARAPIVIPATVADLGDGRRSVLVGTKDGRLLCLDERGAQRWSYATQERLSETESFFVDAGTVHAISSAPLVADVDNDGKMEIVFGTQRGALHCVSAAGKPLWKHECGGAVRAQALADDINSDAMPEVLVGSANGKLTALSGMGKLLFEFMTPAPVESVPCVLKGKGRTLILFGDSAGKLRAITPAQEVVWTLDLKGKITAAPARLSTQEEERFVVGTHAGSVWCVSEHGEIVWEFRTQGSVYGKANVADIDGDGKMEIVFGSCDNTIYAITQGGQRIWSYETDFWVIDTPIVADINGDGRMEVVAGSFDHSVYVLDSEGEYMMDYVPGIAGIVSQAGHYAPILTSEPGEQAGKRLHQIRMDDIVLGCSLLEADGRAEVVVSTKDGHVATLVHEK